MEVEGSLKRKRVEEEESEDVSEDEDDSFKPRRRRNTKHGKEEYASDSGVEESDDDEEDGEGGSENKERNGEDEDEEERETWRQQAEQSRRKKRKLAAKNAGVEGLSESEEEEEDYLGEQEFTIQQQEEHGEKLEPFNLDEEIQDRVINMEKGSVNTVLGKDTDEAWLQDYDQNLKDNRQFAHRMAILKEKLQEQEDNMDAEPEKLSHVQKLKLLDGTAEALLWGETVGQALARLRPPQNKKRAPGLKQQHHEDPKVAAFTALAERADTLMSQLGMNTIYELTKEEVLDKLDTIKAALVKWQYKWDGQPETFGPFTVAEMSEWNAAGYFARQTKDGPSLQIRQLVASKPTTAWMPIESSDLDKIY